MSFPVSSGSGISVGLQADSSARQIPTEVTFIPRRGRIIKPAQCIMRSPGWRKRSLGLTLFAQNIETGVERYANRRFRHRDGESDWLVGGLHPGYLPAIGELNLHRHLSAEIVLHLGL